MKKAIFSLALLLASCPSWAQEEDEEIPLTEIECTITPIDRSQIHPSGGEDVVRAAAAPTQYSSSTNWCGYAAATDLSGGPSSYNTVTYVAGSWIVPQILPQPKTTHCSIWVGIDGYANGTVEQIGTAHDWQNGQQHHFAWFEMYPQGAYSINNFPVNVGDMISAKVGYKGNGVFKLVLSNLTKGVTATIPYANTTSTNAHRTSAEWIVEAPYYSGVAPLSDFGKVSWNYCSATIKGVTGAINNSNWKNDQITLYKSVEEAVPTALLKNGTSFQVVWKAL